MGEGPGTHHQPRCEGGRILREDAMDKLGVGAWKEFVHFGLTSQDVNNTAIPLSLKRATEGVVLPLLDEVISDLSRLALEWKDVPMLARTHGQPASPVTLGKELQVFVERLRAAGVGLADAVYAAKFGGATEQFNAHRVAYPEVDWPAFGQAFVEGKLGLTRTPLTTQIEPYDHLAAWCDALRRIHTVMLDLNRDVWTYISMDYFKQKIGRGSRVFRHAPKSTPLTSRTAKATWGWPTPCWGTSRRSCRSRDCSATSPTAP